MENWQFLITLQKPGWYFHLYVLKGLACLPHPQLSWFKHVCYLASYKFSDSSFKRFMGLIDCRKHTTCVSLADYNCWSNWFFKRNFWLYFLTTIVHLGVCGKRSLCGCVCRCSVSHITNLAMLCVPSSIAPDPRGLCYPLPMPPLCPLSYSFGASCTDGTQYSSYPYLPGANNAQLWSS